MGRHGGHVHGDGERRGLRLRGGEARRDVGADRVDLAVQRVDGNLLNSAVLLSSPWFTRYAGKPGRPLADKEQYGLNPFHRLYRLKDGWVYVTARDETERAALCALADVEAPSAEPADVHPNATPFAEEMTAAFADWTLAETLSSLNAAGVPALEAQSGDSEYFLDDPHAAANDMVSAHDHARAGKLRLARQYIRFADTDVPAGQVTPLLAQVATRLRSSISLVGQFRY